MKAILADDEPLLSLSLKTALAQAWPELEIVAVVPNGLEAVHAAQRLKPDFAFVLGRHSDMADAARFLTVVKRELEKPAGA